MMNGFFVRTHKGIEGFVHLKNVDDYLVYHEAKMLFTSSQGKKYRLGDTIQVQLLKVDMDELKIDFTIYKKREIKSKNKSKKRK
jgi:ribonuclease R